MGLRHCEMLSWDQDSVSRVPLDKFWQQSSLMSWLLKHSCIHEQQYNTSNSHHGHSNTSLRWNSHKPSNRKSFIILVAPTYTLQDHHKVRQHLIVLHGYKTSKYIRMSIKAAILTKFNLYDHEKSLGEVSRPLSKRIRSDIMKKASVILTCL